MANNFVQIKIKGIETNNSELSEVNPGSLADCDNVVLNRDSVLEPRRGFKIYGNAMGASATLDKAKQLFNYKNRILRHFTSTLQFDDGTGVFSSFAGLYDSLRADQKMRGKEVNGNFYFTTSEGIKKISASSAADFTTASGYISDAGIQKALDGVATINSQEGFFLQNSKVAYRIVWGKKDLNNNLLLGSPSQRIVIENSQLTLLIKDFNQLLSTIDTEAASSNADELSDTDYLSTLKINSTSGLASTLRTNLISLADKLENDVNLVAESAHSRTTVSADITANVVTIVLSSAAPSWLQVGDEIVVSGFSGALSVINGTHTVSNISGANISYSLTNTNIVSTPDVGGKIIVNEFNAITQPVIVESPPTTTMLDSLQEYYDAIVDTLLILSTDQISDPTAFSTNFSTQSATTNVNFLIPFGIDSSYFYQIYRTAVAIADGPITLDDIDPGDEMGLVYESNPTSAELTAGEITIHDIVPEGFRGANLYTNPQSGEGILQANERPPIALDINTFKGHTFYANTQTLERLTLSLNGIANLVSGVSSITIASGSTASTYTFVSPVAEVTTITAVADVAGSLNNTYFNLYSGKDETAYYVWYNVSGGGTDPAIADKIGIEVAISTNDADTVVAAATRNALNVLDDFTITGATNQIVITNNVKGVTTDASDAGLTGFTIVISTQGDGENAALNQVLLSDKPTPAQQVEETTRSLIAVINKDSSSPISAYYLSGVDDVPGQFLLENDTLAGDRFYLGSDDFATTGQSFSPNLPANKTITSIAVGNPTTITSASHGLTSGNTIVIYGSNSTSTIDGVRSVTVTSGNTFTVDVEVTVAGTTGSFFDATVQSSNEIAGNRLYFSKFQQPEAVPILNYIDIGARDEEIKRILPLRDGLFVFKEDGLFRVSGESGGTSFNVALFDSNTVLKAPDSADTLNNQILCFTDQGIAAVSDTGVVIISRTLEDQLIPLINFENFSTNTWGLAYDSDRAYLLGTVASEDSTVSDVIYRYNSFTNSWTKWNISKTCGVLANEKIYFGAGDTNFIEEERKTFTREDYADREFSKTVNVGGVNGVTVNVTNANNISIGDALVQEQYLTIYKVNQLLQKLDDDTAPTDNDYLSSLLAVPGDNLRDTITLLATKLDNDAGINDNTHSAAIAAFTSSGPDTQAAYNAIVNKLNANSALLFSNYPLMNDTVKYEALVEAVNTTTAAVTINLALPIIAGDIVVYNHIPTKAVFNVQTFGDSESYKQVSEAKFIFERTNFTKAIISYASDISGAFEEVEFTAYGNGIFGGYSFGQSPFGGGGDRSPIRTFVPRNKQRCRMIIPRIEHAIAREKMVLLGYSMFFRPYSVRAYR